MSKKVLRYVVNVALTLVLADVLARYVAQLPYELAPLNGAVDGFCRAIGITAPEDVELVGLALIYLAALIVAGLAIWLVNAAIWRRATSHA
ncbi:hypothetical protein [Ralstonia solanacearum]|uniref:hypothetical protein n=1 Tax=Ralstonia solanacearum TaxID=305 RepID=UPI00168BA449|nr:hypothetical protein [Ralstonia solanacearum]QNT25379.1 hypothetical protein C2I38_25295 [Ralstonia solanacearum]QNT63026.1 hypothetical protein C2L97_25340 [Ralstonia solanacearum]